MTAQPTWFDLSNQHRQAEKIAKYREKYGPAERARDEGIAVADVNADSAWKRAARARLQEICRTMDTFTTDDVIEPLEAQGIFTHENRAISAIIVGARKAGQIEPTDTYRVTKRVKSHRRPKLVWRVIK